MNRLVVDASVVIKWFVAEEDSERAASLRASARIQAPDLLAVECANILWKKVVRREMLEPEALTAARLIEANDIEFAPTAAAAALAIQLDHPAHGCLYLALAFQRDWSVRDRRRTAGEEAGPASAKWGRARLRPA